MLSKPGVFVVTKIDRLARSIVNLCEIVARIEKRKASLGVLAMNLDTSTPTGKLILNVVGSIAEFEREMMLERQREGIAKAKGEGKYKGRAPHRPSEGGGRPEARWRGHDARDDRRQRRDQPRLGLSHPRRRSEA